jgi:hypothetical protein
MHVNAAQMPVGGFVWVPVPLVGSQHESSDSLGKILLNILSDDENCCGERMRCRYSRQSDPYYCR